MVESDPAFRARIWFRLLLKLDDFEWSNMKWSSSNFKGKRSAPPPDTKPSARVTRQANRHVALRAAPSYVNYMTQKRNLTLVKWKCRASISKMRFFVHSLC
jgi:hypothetical protein